MTRRIVYTNKMDCFRDGEQLWPSNKKSDASEERASEIVRLFLDENVCSLCPHQIEMLRGVLTGLTHREIGEPIGLSAQSVRRSLFRIMRKIRRYCSENRDKLLEGGLFGEIL